MVSLCNVTWRTFKDWFMVAQTGEFVRPRAPHSGEGWCAWWRGAPCVVVRSSWLFGLGSFFTCLCGGYFFVQRGVVNATARVSGTRAQSDSE